LETIRIEFIAVMPKKKSKQEYPTSVTSDHAARYALSFLIASSRR